MFTFNGIYFGSKCQNIYTSSLLFSDLKNNDVVPWVLNSILSKYISSQNPHVRQAACIWLLSLVKKLSQHKEITVGLLHIDGCLILHNYVLPRNLKLSIVQ